MEIRGNTFLVVGGAGLIGSHTVEALLRADAGRVLIFDNFSRGQRINLKTVESDPRVELLPLADIRDESAIRSACVGVDGVFHFAALWLLQCEEDPRLAFDINVRGTFNVLEACALNGVKRVVFSSSASVYGDGGDKALKEDGPFKNQTVYGSTKIIGEELCRLFHQRPLPARLQEIVGLRYMNVYGPRQDYRGAYIAVIMKMLDCLDRNEPLKVYGDGSQSYDFLYVTDAARANIDAMKATTTNRFYNVATGVRTSIKTIAEHLIKLRKSSVGISYHPGAAAFVQHRVGDPSMAETELGFRARVGLDEGLRQLIDWRAAVLSTPEKGRTPPAIEPSSDGPQLP